MTNSFEKIDILSLFFKELEEEIIKIGEPKFRAKQIYSWINKGKWSDEMANIPVPLRKKLDEHFLWTLPAVEKKLVSQIDGTVKYLFKLYDGEYIESVFMRYEHGNTLCISSRMASVSISLPTRPILTFRSFLGSTPISLATSARRRA